MTLISGPRCPAYQPLAPVGATDAEVKRIGEAFDGAEEAQTDGDDKVTHIFDDPEKSEIVRIGDKVKVYNKQHGWMTVEEATAPPSPASAAINPAAVRTSCVAKPSLNQS